MTKHKILYLITVASLFFVTAGYAEVEKNAPKYASRKIENGTKIQLIVGKTIIPAILNESKTSQALISKLPYTVKLQRYSHGFCGALNEKLPYEQNNLHSGWQDGDIVFSKDSNELAILYKDEEISKNLYKGLVILGIVTSPLFTLENLDQKVSVTIELNNKTTQD